MKKYQKLANNKAYRLLNSGSIILLCTKDECGKNNITPIAWQCPLDYDPVTKVLLISDLNHKAFDNISKTKQYVICVPHVSQKELVLNLGSVSGKSCDKIGTFDVEHLFSPLFQIAIPQDCIGYMECRLEEMIPRDGVGIVIGEVMSCMVDEKAFHERLLSENEAGKTLHHLGSKVFIAPGMIVD